MTSSVAPKGSESQGWKIHDNKYMKHEQSGRCYEVRDSKNRLVKGDKLQTFLQRLEPVERSIMSKQSISNEKEMITSDKYKLSFKHVDVENLPIEREKTRNVGGKVLEKRHAVMMEKPKWEVFKDFITEPSGRCYQVIDQTTDQVMKRDALKGFLENLTDSEKTKLNQIVQKEKQSSVEKFDQGTFKLNFVFTRI
jgi:hypothetical protein